MRVCLKDKSDVHYFKLPYIGNLSHHIKNKLSEPCKEFRKENVNIKPVFTSFKMTNYFSYKDPIPDDLKFFQVYTFTCANCSSSYIGETCRHFTLGLRKISKRITSLIFLYTCTPPQHALTRIIIFLLKKLIKLTLNSTEKLRKLYILIGENLT